MIVVMVSKHLLSTSDQGTQKYPQSLMNHIEKEISQRDQMILTEHYEKSDRKKESMRLRISDFCVVVWLNKIL